ncbi:MAG TPA: hypothetical protein VFC64_00565 [Atopostipes sp.]|nr:hypothetical protein [Atopostipes sp.]
MSDEGLYSAMFDLAIENLAQTTYLKDIAFHDATVGFGMDLSKEEEDVGGKSVVFELSREGDRRYKVNPAYSIYMDLVHKCQLMLIELTMTAKSSTAVQEDEIDSLKKKVEKAANGK